MDTFTSSAANINKRLLLKYGTDNNSINVTDQQNSQNDKSNLQGMSSIWRISTFSCLDWYHILFNATHDDQLQHHLSFHNESKILYIATITENTWCLIYIHYCSVWGNNIFWKKLTLLFSKDALNWSKVISQDTYNATIFFSNKCCFFKLSIIY